MKSTKVLALLTAAVMFALVGCYSTPVMPPAGVLVSNIDAPTSLSIAGQDLGSRKGQSTCSAILGLVAWGDCSAKAAADNGGIRQLKQLDHNYLNILFVYQSLTTIAYGD